MAILDTIRIVKLQITISKLTIKIKKLKEKRKQAFDMKISKFQKQRAEEVKKLTKLGGTLEGEDCDDQGKAKKPPKKPVKK